MLRGESQQRRVGICPSQQRFSQSDLAHPHLITLTSYLYSPVCIYVSCKEDLWRKICILASIFKCSWKSFVELDFRLSDIFGQIWLATNVLLPAEAGPQGLWDEHRALCRCAERCERQGRMEHCLCSGETLPASSHKTKKCADSIPTPSAAASDTSRL